MFDSLSGIWGGVSTPFKKDGDKTIWRECSITFSLPNKIVGEGSSVWRDKAIPFKIQGTWDLSSGSFSFFKTHVGEYTNKLEFRGKLDTSSGEFQGQYRSGNFSLRRTKGFPRKSLKEVEVARESKVRPDEGEWDEDPEMSQSSPKSEGLSFLSGNWQGTYTLKSDSHKKTIWRNCQLEFAYENGQGKIRGNGDSVWNEEVVSFKITGTFDLKQQWVTLVKVHTSKYKTLTYNLYLDLKQLMMRGESSHGSLVLTKERVSDKPKKTEPYVEFDKTMLKLPPEPIVTSSSRSSKSPDPGSSSPPSLPSKDSFGTQPAPSGRCSLSPSSRSRGSLYDTTDRLGGRRFNDVALEKVRRSGVRENESGPSFAVRGDLDSRIGSSTLLSSSRSSSSSTFDVKHSDVSSESELSEERSQAHDMYKTLVDRFIETNKKSSQSMESDEGVETAPPEISDSIFSKKQIETLADFRSRHHISDEDHSQIMTRYRVKDVPTSPHSAPGEEEFTASLQSRRSYEQNMGSDVQEVDDKPKSSIYAAWDPRAEPSVVVPTAVVPSAPVASTGEADEDDLMPEMSAPSSTPPPPLVTVSISPSAYPPPVSTDIPQHSPPRERQSSSDSEQLSERETCIVCFNARIDCVILPCGHLAICLGCCSELDLCPLCRGKIRYAQKIFRA